MPPEVLDHQVRLRFADPDRAVAGVRLACAAVVPGPRDFSPVAGDWQLQLPRPPLRRLEYQLEVTTARGCETVCDPQNPARVPTVFGDRSVLELPGYEAPGWLAAPALPGSYRPLEVVGETEQAVPVTVWSPNGTADDEPLPLLLVHDGPEYDLYASLVQYCASQLAAGALPRHRIALAQPVDRDAWYSGSPRYLRTVVHAGLDQLRAVYAVREPVVVMGASLGGLTALLAGLLGAPRVAGVFAQSGSFFQPRLDGSERDFAYFDRVSRVVAQILDARTAEHPLTIGMTCGALEENAANNAVMAKALRRAGHRVDYRLVPDLHNYTAWRDALDPGLGQVLRACWSPQG